MPHYPLVLSISPSQRLRAVVLAAHALVAAVVFMADVDWAYRLTLLAAAAVGLFHFLRLRGEINLRCDPDGSLAVFRDDEWQPVSLQMDSTVLSWAVVLRYCRQEGGRMETCMALADGLDPDEFRRLRVWLKWRGRLLPLQEGGWERDGLLSPG